MRISRSSNIAAAGLTAAVVSVTALACARGPAFEGQAASASTAAQSTNGVGRENVTYVRVPSAQAPETYATDSRLGGPVVVACGAGQRALVRPSVVRGEQVSQVECVGDAYGPAYGAYTAGYGTYDRPAIVTSSDIRTVPVVRSSPARERRVVTTERRSGRSWKKTALVIGGSTAAGAGIGGLIGGKKGALIGAALGGGASSIYEATKR